MGDIKLKVKLGDVKNIQKGYKFLESLLSQRVFNVVSIDGTTVKQVIEARINLILRRSIVMTDVGSDIRELKVTDTAGGNCSWVGGYYDMKIMAKSAKATRRRTVASICIYWEEER